MKFLQTKLDRIFSQFIRLRDSKDGLTSCITCGRMGDFKSYDCGHFISRRFQSTRYDEKNCNSQCIKCNRFEYGNQYEHGLKIDQKHGKGTAEALYIKSKQVTKRTRYDYEYLIKEYKEKIKAIERA